ncbi:MAG: beta-ketoacyl-ACP synthase II [Chloroflexi bacterium]|nr:beta-ketoacyl-ACP synthase II [Chloroflexota bacterium]
MTQRSGRDRRVVVTGMGVISPLGSTVDELWERALNGESGITALTAIEPGDYPCKVAGQVHDFEPNEWMDRKDARRMARFSQFAIAAGKQAIADAGLDLEAIDRHRAGALLGTGNGSLPHADQAMRTILSRGGNRLDPLYMAKMLPNMAAGNLTIQLGLLGYTNTVTTACAAATQAIGDATEVIRRGHADVMLAGGTEAGISELGLAGFCAMRALTTSYNDRPGESSRPFDRDRDGFAPSEGAGVLVIEELEHARARGAEPLAELIGYGVTADATFLVAPPEDGAGAARAIRLAIEDAGITPGDVDYISAHATATEVGDIAETRAIRSVFGEAADRIPVTAFKSQIGHLLGAAGGVEAIAAVQTLRTSTIAPTINLENPDPECDLDYVPLQPRSADIRTLAKNSFGFGGQNAVLILRRFED